MKVRDRVFGLFYAFIALIVLIELSFGIKQKINTIRLGKKEENDYTLFFFAIIIILLLIFVQIGGKL